MKKHEPLRKCLSTGQSLPKEELLRFVKGPEGHVWFDVSGKAPGRGAYTCIGQKHVLKVVQKRGLSKFLEGQVPEDLAVQVEKTLHQQALQALGFAKKAGKLAIGLEEVLKIQKKEPLVGLVLAQDAGENARLKTQSFHGDRCSLFTKAELEKIVNVPNTSVVGLTDGKIWHTLQRAELFMQN